MSNSIVRRAPNPVTKKTSFKLIPKSEIVKDKAIGLGAVGEALRDINKIKAASSLKEGLGQTGIIDAINAAVACPLYNMPIIEQVRWGLDGPMLDVDVQKNFGAEIDLFGSGKSPQGIDYVETTMAQTGQTQTHMIACALLLHLEPEPLCWTAHANGWTTPATALTPPISPDVYDINDINNGAFGTAVQEGDQAIVQAFVEWGWWSNYAFWHLARGYNLRWKIGHHTNIMDEVARHVAYTPTNAQEGSASSSEVDVQYFFRTLNNHYRSLGSGLIALPVNRIRIGSMTATVGNANVNVGDFKPSRDHQKVPATYGGMDLRSMLHGNSEARVLALPYIIRAGVPIGLILQENDTDQANTMRNYISITNGFGGSAPAQFTVDENIPAGLSSPDGGASPEGLELTLDSSPLEVAQRMQSDSAIFKGGNFKITLGVKGFEVTDDALTALSNNPALMDVVMSECNVRLAKVSG
jgi:hypothetical protein